MGRVRMGKWNEGTSPWAWWDEVTEGRNQQPVLKINKIIQLQSIVCRGNGKKKNHRRGSVDWGGSNREVSEDSQQGWQWRITVTAATHICKDPSSCSLLHPCVRPPHWPMHRVSSSFKDWKLQTVGVKRLGPALSYIEFQRLEVDLHLCSSNPISSEQSTVDWDAMGNGMRQSFIPPEIFFPW